MKKTELYNNFLSKLETSLLENNKENIDFILEAIYTMGLPDQDIEKIDDILQEATLYLELWDEEYRVEALELIINFKN